MRDIRSNIKVVPVIEPGVYPGKSEGKAVDTAGYDSLTFAIAMGEAGKTGGFELAMEHSDDGKEWELVRPDNVLGEAGLDAPFGYTGGTTGQRRYVRLSLSPKGKSTKGTGLAVMAILGHRRGA
jgi:hypothetical protein